MIDFADLHKHYPLTFYSTLIMGHKALGHEVHDTFWQAVCRTCGWRADLSVGANTPSEWTVTTA